MTFTPLFAQDPGTPPAGETVAGTGQADPAAKGAPAAPASWIQFGLPVLIILFFLVMVLPQKRRAAKAAAARAAAMKPGAKIVTNSGIVGRIISMKDGEEEIVIKSEETKLRILKSTIASVVSDETPALETKA